MLIRTQYKSHSLFNCICRYFDSQFDLLLNSCTVSRQDSPLVPFSIARGSGVHHRNGFKKLQRILTHRVQGHTKQFLRCVSVQGKDGCLDGALVSGGGGVIQHPLSVSLLTSSA